MVQICKSSLMNYTMWWRLQVSSGEKVELAAYQLKGVAQVCLTQWKFQRVEEGAIDWEMFKDSFLEFMNLKQEGMNVGEYALKYTKLPKFATSFVADSRVHMNNFTLGVLFGKDGMQCFHAPQINGFLQTHDIYGTSGE